MDTVAQFVDILLQVYILCVFVWALLSWLPMVSPGLAHNDTVTGISRFLDSIVLPWVKLFKFVPPVRMGGAYLDLSAMAAIITLLVLKAFLPGIIAGLDG